ncbi:MAG: lysophospholipid acyltransferase family protein [Planctomycetota bacterium]
MKQKLLSFLAWLMIKLVCKTISFKVINKSALQDCLASGRQFVFAFWHGRQFLLLGWNEVKQLAILTSLSRDGRLQSAVLTRLRLKPVLGSSSSGARRGLIRMIRAVKEGSHAAFAVDGPCGPLYIVKPGVIYLAAKTGCIIIPLTARAKYRSVFKKAWDQYELPCPFSPAVVILGKPIMVSPEADEKMMEQKRQELENVIRKITEQADNYFP